MHYLIFLKQKPHMAEPGIEVREFESRRELLVYAIENRVKLHAERTAIIGPQGLERGSADPHAELLQAVAAEQKEKAKVEVEVPNG